MGLANYKMLFQDPEFLGALKNTVVFVLVAVVLNICISTFLAVLIKSLRKKGQEAFSWLDVFAGSSADCCSVLCLVDYVRSCERSFKSGTDGTWNGSSD